MQSARSQAINFIPAVLLGLLLISLISPGVQGGLWRNALNRAYSLMGYEVCEHPYVHNSAVRRLRNALRTDLFGQHLAQDITVKALRGHFEDPNPQKALVLSFHGWAGSGKTFTAQHIINAMYREGMNSSFVRFFLSSYHFPDPSKTQEYKELIKRNIEKVVKQCPRALFVFDEVDKTPPGVLDALVPYIQHPGDILDGVNYKRAAFVLLSNIGANDITRITQQAWKDGRKREELTFKDFEDTLSNEAFNSEAGGLYKSRMIDRILVDYFIPYLPLERRHIVSCAKVEAIRHGMGLDIVDEEAEKVADMITYWPADLKLFSTTGCKKVDTYVKLRMAELYPESVGSDEEDLDEDDAYNYNDHDSKPKTDL